MADYFLSDVHLRHDRPDRGLRLARLVARIGPADSLTIVGDLCDFWLAARQRRLDPMRCPGLRSLADYRARGGRLTVFAGNHDLWLEGYYRAAIDPAWVDDDRRVESHGLRLYLAHGHRLGARGAMKSAMESRAFLRAFGGLPSVVAHRLEARLDRSNERHRAADNGRLLGIYRGFAPTLDGQVDLVVLGHLHQAADDRASTPRLVVLGNWHERASYLRIDESGACFHVEPDMPVIGSPGAIARDP